MSISQTLGGSFAFGNQNTSARAREQNTWRKSADRIIGNLCLVNASIPASRPQIGEEVDLIDINRFLPPTRNLNSNGMIHLSKLRRLGFISPHGNFIACSLEPGGQYVLLTASAIFLVDQGDA